MSDIAVSIRNLSKAYVIAHNAVKHTTMGEALMHRLRQPLQRPQTETFWALKDISLDIRKGDVVGIIGRNGAGKSTLLKILSRITEPTHGEAHLYGRVGSLLEVGTGFHPELTGRENIYLNGAILGMKRREIARQFDAIVDFAGTETFLDTPVKRYSSGMYVRLAFAVAAHLNPEILIVDEVLAVGDAEFQTKCLGKMQDVAAKDGRTVIFVSHNMAAIQRLCNRALLMRAGKLRLDDATEQVVAEYLSDGYVSKDGQFDLSVHPARAKEHAPLIKRLALYDAEGTPTTNFYPDSTLIAEFTVDTDKPIKEPRAAVAIEDAYGRRIYTAASFFKDREIADIQGRCLMRCQIPALKLGSGRYLISVSISNKYTGLLDSVDGAAWFEVTWRNNYGNGEPYSPVYGPVLIDSFWEQIECDFLPTAEEKLTAQ